ncbi:MAG: hypothetical protein LBU69_03925, partial [Deltaproteobacteria bacterium]|nr:hypothetical protein [Deltaproteobacteria bacterium]
MSPKRNNPPAGGQSLFKQMGQGFDKVLGKLNRRAAQPPPQNAPQDIDTSNPLTLCWRLEEILLNDDEKNPWPLEVIKFALAYSGLSWGFLTEILAGDPQHFVI